MIPSVGVALANPNRDLSFLLFGEQWISIDIPKIGFEADFFSRNGTTPSTSKTPSVWTIAVG